MYPHPAPADPEERWLRSLFASRDDPGLPDLIPPTGLLLDRWRTWFAPIGQREACWLDGVVSMANAHTVTGAALLRLQLAVEAMAADRRRTYRPVSVVPQALRDDLIWLTALGRLGMRFLPEILGITLAHVRLRGGVFQFAGEGAYDYQAVQQALTTCLGLPLDPSRLAAGIAFYHRRSRAWLSAWDAIAADPRRQVLALLQEKARYGHGYHARIQVGGRPLDEWLTALENGEGEAFLNAFLNSPWKDRFLTQTLAFGGPMFGVFSQAEQELIRTWLSWEQANPSCPQWGDRESAALASAESLSSPTGRERAGMHPPAPSKPNRRLSSPQLYHQLLHLDRFPTCLPAARALVKKILTRAGRGKAPFSYTWVAFRQWVEASYAQETGAGSEPPCLPLSKAACLWGIEQFAPAILIDGCWLSKALPLVRLYPTVGQALWKIFRDEVGDGEPAHNHANIYRKLLKQAGIRLPAFDSEDFIRHRGFIPGAFDLPAFLLAIGQFPEDFLPELLGLNLAIELSGLGRIYRRLARTLESHGLDATIVHLHQSIDNLASGHAALACDAILAHFQAMALGGEETVQQQWHRVWTGYRSLAVAARRFTWVLMITWGWKFGISAPLARLRGAGADL